MPLVNGSKHDDNYVTILLEQISREVSMPIDV
jgi:hypothetical protein